MLDDVAFTSDVFEIAADTCVYLLTYTVTIPTSLADFGT